MKLLLVLFAWMLSAALIGSPLGGPAASAGPSRLATSQRLAIDGARAEATPSKQPIYVDRDATGAGNGSSWADAHIDLQDALDAAAPGDEIWVAEGVYTPTVGITRTATFSLVDGVSIYGGFVATETRRQQRDWEANVTVLSGDLDGNDVTDANGVITHTRHITGANAFHVVTGDDVTRTAVLDGFVVTGGWADGGAEDGQGGGMINVHASPTLRNTIFSGNYAEEGGGVYAADGSQPALTHVTFRGNSAGGGGTYSAKNSPILADVVPDDEAAVEGGRAYAQEGVVSPAAAAGNGGGMCSEGGSSPQLTSVTFRGNYASLGGGMYSAHSSPVLSDVVFIDNQAAGGGGMHNRGSTLVLTNVTFRGNQAGLGGGMYNVDSDLTLTDVVFRDNRGSRPIGLGGGVYNDGSALTLTNVVFSGNRVASFGGGLGAGMHNADSSLTLANVTLNGNQTDSDGSGGGMYNQSSDVTLTNSILWGNSDGGGTGETAQITATDGSAITVTYSLIQGAAVYTGTGVVDEDPQFVDPQDDLHLRPTSPAIDAGDNGAVSVSCDLDGAPRRVDVLGVEDTGTGSAPIVDMGAYEASFTHLYLPLVVRSY